MLFWVLVFLLLFYEKKFLILGYFVLVSMLAEHTIERWKCLIFGQFVNSRTLYVAFCLVVVVSSVY